MGSPSHSPGLRSTVVSLDSSANEVFPKYVILSNEPLPVNQLGRQLARILAVKEIDDVVPFKKISEERRKSLSTH
jgi:hypothetical protein